MSVKTKNRLVLTIGVVRRGKGEGGKEDGRGGGLKFVGRGNFPARVHVVI